MKKKKTALATKPGGIPEHVLDAVVAAPLREEATETTPHQPLTVKPNYWRQLDMFKGVDFNLLVHIFGVGATGSYIAETVAKMGVQGIVVYDHDDVDDHNIPNQLYGTTDFKQLKVDALKTKLKELTGVELFTVPKKIAGIKNLSGIVFLCVDSMASRKKIWESSIKQNPDVKLMIETRMGAEVGKIFIIDPSNPEHIKQWEATLFEDKPEDAPVCTNTAINSTIKTMVGYAAHSLVCYMQKQPYPNELMLCMRPPTLYTKSWVPQEKKSEQA